MTWFSLVCAVISLALGVVHLIRLVAARRGGLSPMSEAAHAAMGVGMAAMFSPFGDPLPAPVWPAVFGVIVVWFGVAAFRSGWLTNDAGHHVVGGAAMLFMIFMGMAGHSGHSTSDASMPGMDMSGPAGTHGAWTSVLALCFAGYFAWHVMRCGDRFLAGARARTAGPVPVPAGVEGPVAATGPGGARPAEAAALPSDGGVATAESEQEACACATGSTGRGPFALIGTPRVAAGTHLMMASVMAAMLLAML